MMMKYESKQRENVFSTRDNSEDGVALDTTLEDHRPPCHDENISMENFIFLLLHLNNNGYFFYFIHLNNNGYNWILLNSIF